MRVLAWQNVNKHGLVSVKPSERAVKLIYKEYPAYPMLAQELARLVTEESGCCGAVGGEFVLNEHADQISVLVSVTREGLPSRTVLAAFSKMHAWRKCR